MKRADRNWWQTTGPSNRPRLQPVDRDAPGREAANAASGSVAAQMTATGRSARRTSTGERIRSRLLGRQDAVFTPPGSRGRSSPSVASATLLMTELALTRIFSVVDVLPLRLPGDFDRAVRTERQRRVRVTRAAPAARPRRPTRCSRPRRCSTPSVTIVALFVLVRLRVGLNYSPENLLLMLTIYALAALPFFAGGLVITLAISPLCRPRQHRVRGRSDWRRRRLPAADPAARPRRRARRRS